MKCTLERDELLRAVEAAARIVVTGSPIPILTHLRISAAKGKAEVWAHAMDTCLAFSLGANVSEPGEVAIPTSLWLGLLKQMPEGSHVELSAGERRVQMACGKSKYALPILPAIDFPPLLMLADAVAEFDLSEDEVEQCFDRCSFSVGDNLSQLYAQGVFIEYKKDGKKLLAVATNGKQIVRLELAAPKGVDALPENPTDDKRRKGVLVPGETMREIVRIARGAGATLRVARNAIEIERGGLRYTSKLIDCIYPGYEALFDRAIASGTGFVVSREALKSALARLRVIAEREQGKAGWAAAFRWDEGEQAIRISLSNATGGDGEEEVEAETTGAMTEGLGLPVNQFASMLDAISGDNVQVNAADHTQPARVSDPADPRLSMIQQPAWA